MTFDDFVESGNFPFQKRRVFSRMRSAGERFSNERHPMRTVCDACAQKNREHFVKCEKNDRQKSQKCNITRLGRQ